MERLIYHRALSNMENVENDPQSHKGQNDKYSKSEEGGKE